MRLAAETVPPAPFLVSWNLTKRCNLKCAHCYLDSTELDGGSDLSTGAALKIVREVAGLAPGAMLILTGGEPLLRPDLFKIAASATGMGLTVVVGTNGTLLDGPMVDRLKASGVKGVGLSLDSATPGFHDRFRGQPGSWNKTVSAAGVLREKGLEFQLQTTVTRENITELPGVALLAERLGARALNVFFLICTGRGQSMTDLTPREYEETLESILRLEAEYSGRLMVRARCAPHILRIASTGPGPGAAGPTSGCIAGTGYLRISPDARVTPCPYIPVTDKTPGLDDKNLEDIWNNAPEFRTLRGAARTGHKGRCGECEFSETCGGCRARALATTGDLLGEDEWCVYEPGGEEGRKDGTGENRPVWTPAAAKRIEKVPAFLRDMVRSGVERYAQARGLKEITPELMQELKDRAGLSR